MKNIALLLTAFILVLQLCSCSQKAELTVDDLLRRAVKHGDNGNWEMARLDAERAVSENPMNANAVVMYAISLEHDGKITTALNEMDKVGSSVPEHFMAQFTLGRMLYNKGDQGGGSQYFSSALEPLTRAADLRTESVETQVLLAMCMTKLGMYDKAFKVFDKLRKNKQFKDSPEVYNEAGIVMALSYAEEQSQSKLKVSKSYFHAAFNRGKKTPKVVLNLAVFYDQYLGDKSTSVKLYDRYLSLAKGNHQLSSEYDQVKRRRDLISQ